MCPFDDEKGAGEAMIPIQVAEHLARVFVVDHVVRIELTLDENPPPAYNTPASEWHFFAYSVGEAWRVGGSDYIAVHKKTGQVRNVGRLGD
jgi:hypothetical protein